MNSFNFELTSAIKYAKNGQEIECNFIEFREPTGKHTGICCAIESLVQSKLAAMVKDSAEWGHVETTENVPSGNDESLSDKGKSMLAMMAVAGVDMEKIILYFRQLFKEVAFMGGEKKITEARLDDLSHTDLKNMIGQYAANFILN